MNMDDDDDTVNISFRTSVSITSHPVCSIKVTVSLTKHLSCAIYMYSTDQLIGIIKEGRILCQLFEPWFFMFNRKNCWLPLLLNVAKRYE